MVHEFTADDDVTRITVRVTYRESGYRQSEMEERTLRGADGKTQTPTALRAVPLLAILGAAGSRRVVIGSTRVVSDLCRSVAEVFISSVWLERSFGVFVLRQADVLKPIFDPNEYDQISKKARKKQKQLKKDEAQDRQRVENLLVKDFNEMALNPFGQGQGSSHQHLAAGIAKSLSEASRDSLQRRREIRYLLEHRLAETSSASESSTDHTSVVSSLIQLNIMCGRASDEAREAVREGLWVHVTDVNAYHAYRRLRDPSLVIVQKPPRLKDRPWFRLHDAAMRQCEELRKQLDGESASINTLIVAGASVSSAKDADAQTRFNVLAAMASVGLGLPALVLTLYGASILLPMNTAPRLLAFAPVAVSLAMAVGIALWQGHRQKRGAIWNFGAIVIMLVLLLLLLAAGYFAPALET